MLHTMNSRACIGLTTRVVRHVLLLGALLFAASAAAELSKEQLHERLLLLNPSQAADQIRPSPVPGLYEVLYGAEVLYITDDGEHLIWNGDLYNLDGRNNLTETSRAGARAELLEAYGEDRMLIFPATAPRRHAIVVVTDIDCPYCRKFHEHVEELNAAGIEIRYLLYPRAGEDSTSYHKSVSVWCSEDRRDALTRAKRLEPIPPATCANPILEHIDLVNRVNVSSTPTIFLPDGTLVRGYRPPADLLPLLAD